MQTPSPDLTALPLWAQLLITVIVGLGTLGVAFKGYFARKAPDAPNTDKGMTALVAASIQDMGHMRHLADVCIRLTGTIERMTEQLKDNEHELRNSNDLHRETCARLRELREELERARGSRH